jgi:hypothetical protein
LWRISQGLRLASAYILSLVVTLLVCYIPATRVVKLEL